MPADLEGRTAIVTGGARGIGEAIVQRLAEAGCNLVINCHTSVDAAEALAETVRAGGSGAEVVAGSIADPATGRGAGDAGDGGVRPDRHSGQ